MTGRWGWVMLALIAAAPGAASAADTPRSTVDLTGPFATRSPWRLIVTQGAPVEGITDEEPGVVRPCLTRDRGATCDPAPLGLLALDTPDDFATIHYLDTPHIVRPLGPRSPAMLLMTARSIHSGDGDQRHGMLALVYDRAGDRFRTVYRQRTGKNNNQEIRYLDRGPLAGAIVSAEPMRHAPFGYWITVSRPGRNLTYRTRLRYRSATRYDDGNALAVIDSEMPAIERRLELWRPGRPLPLPASGCAAPRLVAGALWCGPKR